MQHFLQQYEFCTEHCIWQIDLTIFAKPFALSWLIGRPNCGSSILSLSLSLYPVMVVYNEAGAPLEVEGDLKFRAGANF